MAAGSTKKSGYSRTLSRSVQLRFANDLADFGERLAENDKAWSQVALRSPVILERYHKVCSFGLRMIWLILVKGWLKTIKHGRW